LIRRYIRYRYIRYRYIRYIRYTFDTYDK
jgi:hypothetical protein